MEDLLQITAKIYERQSQIDKIITDIQKRKVYIYYAPYTWKSKNHIELTGSKVNFKTIDEEIEKIKIDYPENKKIFYICVNELGTSWSDTFNPVDSVCNTLELFNKINFEEFITQTSEMYISSYEYITEANTKIKSMIKQPIEPVKPVESKPIEPSKPVKPVIKGDDDDEEEFSDVEEFDYEDFFKLEK